MTCASMNTVGCRAMRTRIAKSALALFGLLLTGSVHAQAYPGPVKMVVTFAPGGYTDTVARIIVDRLSARLGQQVIIENRAGANGNIGSLTVAQSAPDGTTILMANDGTLVINPHIYSKLSFRPLEDFTAVTNVSSTPMILVAHPSIPPTDVRSLIAYAKSKSQPLFFASTGTGSLSHLGGELLKQVAGIEMEHVAYKGGAQAITDVVGGRIQLQFAAPGTARPYTQSGKLKALGVTSARRLGLWPELSTFVESGYPDYVLATWNGVLVPARTPRPIIDRLQKEIATTLQEPAIRERFASLGYEAIGNTPEQFADQIRSDFAKWGKVVKQAAVKPVDID